MDARYPQEGNSQKKRAEQKLRRTAEQSGESENLRGHTSQQILQISGIRSGWRCKTCRKMSSKTSLLTKSKCTGDPFFLKWSKIECEEEAQLKPVDEHKRMLSGNVLWFCRCGVYADKKAKRLKDLCKGKPPKGGGGCMEGQLRKLRNNVHPKAGESLPWPVEADTDTVPAKPNVVNPNHSPPKGFYEYIFRMCSLLLWSRTVSWRMTGGASFTRGSKLRNNSASTTRPSRSKTVEGASGITCSRMSRRLLLSRGEHLRGDRCSLSVVRREDSEKRMSPPQMTERRSEAKLVRVDTQCQLRRTIEYV